jgi:hypothetical protein
MRWGLPMNWQTNVSPISNHQQQDDKLTSPIKQRPARISFSSSDTSATYCISPLPSSSSSSSLSLSLSLSCLAFLAGSSHVTHSDAELAVWQVSQQLPSCC